jgi:dephospho-CoA kinase
LFGTAAEDHEINTPAGNKMKILGICGGIGSGKSTACQLMVDKLGCVARIDADKLAHCVYEPGSQSLQEIVAEFGNDILLSSSGKAEIDRQKLGAIVFSDPNAMSKLEKIVWPHVRTKIEERIHEITTEYQSASSSASKNEIIIVEAALLLETDWHDMLDELWVVQASPSVAVKRLMENRGLSEEDALVRIRAQQKRRSLLSKSEDSDCISDELREEMEKGIVTAVVTNDGTLEDLQKTLEKTLCDDAAFKKGS